MNPGNIVSSLVATKLRVVLVGLLIVGVTIGGAFAVGILGAPSIAAIDNTFGEVTDEETAIETDLIISNPNPVGFGTDDVSVNYTISMNSIEMAYGGHEGVAVRTGNSTLDLETQMRNDAIPPWWTSHIKNDEQTVIGIDATVTSDRLGRSADLSRTHEIETDILSAFNSEETRPVNADSPLTDDPVLYINETQGQWGSVTDEETPIDMEFVVYNPNLEPYAITELGYDITMNEVDVGEGETHQQHVISSYSSETIGLTTTINNQHLDEWWVTHLDEDHGHQVSKLRIEFYAVVELPSGDEITVPLDELTYEEPIETDIFDEGGDAGEPTTSNGDDTEADDDESTKEDDQGSNGDETDEDSNGEETDDDEESDGNEEEDDGEDGSGDDGLLV